MRPFKSKKERKEHDPKATSRKEAAKKETLDSYPEDTVGEEGGGQGATRGIWGGSLAHERSKDT